MAKHRGSPLALTILSLLHYKPLHPYGMQQLIRRWGKDAVVNVSQRTSLYRTIDRLAADGLVSVRSAERDQAYPERTVYEVTDDGRAAAREMLEEMLAAPKREFPEFAAALSNLLLLMPAEAAPILARRLAAVTEHLGELKADLTTYDGLARVTMLETEYLYAVAKAEQVWLRGVVRDLDSGALTWSAGDFAESTDTLR